MPTPLTGHQILAQVVAENEVSHVFMVPTIAVRAFAEMEILGVRGVMAHTEKAAAYMADGYARVARRPGVCMAQAIGSSNLASGLRDARMAGAPVVAITGGPQSSTRGKGVYQEINDLPTFDPLTTYNERIEDASRISDVLRRAFREAVTSAPSPVHVELPGGSGAILDDLVDDPEIGEHRTTPPGVPPFRPVPDDRSLEAAVELLRAAERPIVVAGGGVRTSGAEQALAAFAAAWGLPVATSLTGKGVVDESSSTAVGVVGASSTRSANQAVALADLVVFVGSSVGSQVTDGWRLPDLVTQVVQIDIDASVIGRNYPLTTGVSGDAAAALDFLTAKANGAVDRASWLEDVADLVATRRSDDLELLKSDDEPIRPERICAEISAFLPDDGVAVIDTGHSGLWAAAYMELRPSQQCIRAAGSLGWSFPAAIGAKCAAGARMVVAFTGDGGLYYHLSEIETAARNGIAPIIVVNNNVSLGQDMKIFRKAWGGVDQMTAAADSMWRFVDVEISDVARAMGAHSERVDRPSEIGPALRRAAASGRIAVLDVRTAAEALPPIPHGGRDFYGADDD